MRDTTTDTDLRAYLDAHGTDGPIPDDAQHGWYALLTDDGYAWVGLLERAGLWLPSDAFDASPGEVPRHAPLHLAAPGEVERLRARVAELEARQAEACPLCYGSSRYASDVDCDRCGNTGAVLVTP